MNYILFDDNSWDNILPITFTRPVSEIRIGVLTIKEKWDKFLNSTCSYKTIEYLSHKYKLICDDISILINGSILPNQNFIDKINSLELNQCLVKDNVLIAVCVNKNDAEEFNYKDISKYNAININEQFIKLNFAYDIFTNNDAAITADYDLITANRNSQTLSKTNNILGLENIFVEEGAKVEFATINATNGKVYIGKDAEIMEGSLIRAPFAICEHSTLKMGAKIYGATTIGPHSKVGGEVNNSVIIGYSNKAHDGFLGNSVLGEWCNIGADSNNSNLKNNYAEVKIWNYPAEKFVKTGLSFCGLIMGDHSKCAINTMFNTGTVVGVSSNIFGSGFPRNFIPSFIWGGAEGMTTYTLTKAFDTAELVMQRRNINLDDIEKEILSKIFELTKKSRAVLK